jgi:hypothetical protein
MTSPAEHYGRFIRLEGPIVCGRRGQSGTVGICSERVVYFPYVVLGVPRACPLCAVCTSSDVQDN